MKAHLEHALHAIWRSKGIFALALWPLAQLYAAIVTRRQARFLEHPDLIHHETVPVLVVGNIYIGGTGKTPVVIALVQALQQRGWQPGVVSRGYGAQHGDRPRTGRGTLDATQFGDEPALIAAETGAPIAVHPDRQAAIRRLRRQYPDVDVVISDDGLQHLALGRDLEIIVQDARGIGNGWTLPAGPLREPARRLQTADFVINNLQPGETRPSAAAGMAHVLDMVMEPALVERLGDGEKLPWEQWLARHSSAPCAAVAAIGRPERFFTMLRHHGAQLQHARALPDHYSYEHSPFDQLDSEAILITAKDAVKCRKFNDPRLYCVHPVARFSDEGWLDLVHDMLRAISERKQTAARAEELNSEL